MENRPSSLHPCWRRWNRPRVWTWRCCVGIGCNGPEELNSELLDSRSFMRALENHQHTCAKFRMLTGIHQHLRPAPAGLDVPQPAVGRLLSRHEPLPLCVDQSAHDENIYHFNVDQELPQPCTSRHHQRMVYSLDTHQHHHHHHYHYQHLRKSLCTTNTRLWFFKTHVHKCVE